MNKESIEDGSVDETFVKSFKFSFNDVFHFGKSIERYLRE